MSPLSGQSTFLSGLDIQDMLPENLRYYYSYWGSLTTPPCTENVHWFLLADTVQLSKAQVPAALRPGSPWTAWRTRALPKPHTGPPPGLLWRFPWTDLLGRPSIARAELTRAVAETGQQAPPNPRSHSAGSRRTEPNPSWGGEVVR